MSFHLPFTLTSVKMSFGVFAHFPVVTVPGTVPAVSAHYWSVCWQPHSCPLVLFCATGNGREVEDWEQVGMAASMEYGLLDSLCSCCGSKVPTAVVSHKIRGWPSDLIELELCDALIAM